MAVEQQRPGNAGPVVGPRSPSPLPRQRRGFSRGRPCQTCEARVGQGRFLLPGNPPPSPHKLQPLPAGSTLPCPPSVFHSHVLRQASNVPLYKVPSQVGSPFPYLGSCATLSWLLSGPNMAAGLSTLGWDLLGEGACVLVISVSP